MTMTPYRRLSGYTLVEILVVLLIVSIMSGLAVINLPAFTRSGDFDLESQRIKTLLDMAREESIVRAIEFGFKPTENTYSFYIYDEMERKWFESDLSPFQPRSLPDDIKLELKVEGDPLPMPTEGDDSVPPVLLLSSGETTPFTLNILQESTLELSLESDGYSDIKWLEDE